MTELRYIDTILGNSQEPPPDGSAPTEPEALDAYSRIVVSVAERLSPSVANLRVYRRSGPGEGGGSGVAITPDGFIVTSAHVVQGTDRGEAVFSDGREVLIVSLTHVRVSPSMPLAAKVLQYQKHRINKLRKQGRI